MSLDRIPDPIVVLRPDGSILDLNEHFATLASDKKEGLLGKNFSGIRPLGLIADKISDALAALAENLELLTVDEKHFEVFIRPFGTGGTSRLVHVLMKDISNFVNLERELLQRNRELMMINTLSGAFMSSENMDIVIDDLLKKVLPVTPSGGRRRPA